MIQLVDQESSIPEQHREHFENIAGRAYAESCLCRTFFRVDIPSISDIYVIDLNEAYSEFYSLMIEMVATDPSFACELETDEYVAAHDYVSENFDNLSENIIKELYRFLTQHDFVLRDHRNQKVFNHPIRKVW